LEQNHKISALLLDDSRTVRLLMSRALTGAGFHVVEAASGEAALERMKEQKIAVFLIDVTLPGISGIEVATQVRQEPQYKATPIFLLSGSATEMENTDENLNLSGCLEKPVDPIELLRKIRRALDNNNP